MRKVDSLFESLREVGEGVPEGDMVARSVFQAADREYRDLLAKRSGNEQS